MICAERVNNIDYFIMIGWAFCETTFIGKDKTLNRQGGGLSGECLGSG